MIDEELVAKRLKTLEIHFQSEIDHDWQACIDTFHGEPRYEIVPLGQIHEGVEAVTEYHRAQRTAFPDQRHENVRMHPSTDAIVAEFDLLGTNTGEFMGMAPTGKAFRVPVVAVFQFEGELVTNERVYLDVASLVKQVGREELLPFIGVEDFAAPQMKVS